MVRNLRAAANSVTRVINPNISATLYVSNGNIIDANYVQQPNYVPYPMQAQVQALTSGDLRMLDALNIQGAQKTVFLNGVALGVVRIKQRGGDILLFGEGGPPEGNVWLVKASLEQWGRTWAKVAIALQDQTIAQLINGQ